MSENPHKDMILMNLWLKPEELEMLERHFDSEFGSLLVIGDILEKAKIRGDFKK